MSTMKAIVLEKEREIYCSQNVKCVTLPSESGEITVYPNHIAIVTLMKNGTIDITFEENGVDKHHSVEIKEGLFSFKNNEAVFLVKMPG